jgi:hypothetical protein
MVLEQLLDFSVPLDVGLLDKVVYTLHSGTPADVCLPRAWTLLFRIVDAMLLAVIGSCYNFLFLLLLLLRLLLFALVLIVSRIQRITNLTLALQSLRLSRSRLLKASWRHSSVMNRLGCEWIKSWSNRKANTPSSLLCKYDMLHSFIHSYTHSLARSVIGV